MANKAMDGAMDDGIGGLFHQLAIQKMASSDRADYYWHYLEKQTELERTLSSIREYYEIFMGYWLIMLFGATGISIIAILSRNHPL
jgi:hypothetical protein